MEQKNETNKIIKFEHFDITVILLLKKCDEIFISLYYIIYLIFWGSVSWSNCDVEYIYTLLISCISRFRTLQSWPLELVASNFYALGTIHDISLLESVTLLQHNAQWAILWTTKYKCRSRMIAVTFYNTFWNNFGVSTSGVR